MLPFDTTPNFLLGKLRVETIHELSLSLQDRETIRELSLPDSEISVQLRRAIRPILKPTPPCQFDLASSFLPDRIPALLELNAQKSIQKHANGFFRSSRLLLRR